MRQPAGGCHGLQTDHKNQHGNGEGGKPRRHEPKYENQTGNLLRHHQSQQAVLYKL